jgi:hypothetical protein
VIFNEQNLGVAFVSEPVQVMADPTNSMSGMTHTSMVFS